MSIYKQLQWRGFIKDVSREDKAKELLENENVKFYCGFDPTGESLTVGHLVQIVRMMVLEPYGHTPVVLIGGGTGLIGDPRQTGERKLLPLEQSLKNAQLMEKQIKNNFTEEQKYKELRNHYFTYIDNENSKRTYQYISSKSNLV